MADLNYAAYVRMFLYMLIGFSQALLSQLVDIESGKLTLETEISYWILYLNVFIPVAIIARSFLDQSLSGKSKL